MDIDFCPENTPLDVPVLTSFYVNGRMYVVDVMGTLFCLHTEGDDPDFWCWYIVHEL